MVIERETARRAADEREQRKEMQQKMEERMRCFAQEQAVSEAAKAHAAASAAADSVEKLKLDSNVKTSSCARVTDTATELREADRVADNMKKALRELCVNERSRREAAALQTVTNVRETLCSTNAHWIALDKVVAQQKHWRRQICRQKRQHGCRQQHAPNDNGRPAMQHCRKCWSSH